MRWRWKPRWISEKKKKRKQRWMKQRLSLSQVAWQCYHAAYNICWTIHLQICWKYSDKDLWAITNPIDRNSQYYLHLSSIWDSFCTEVWSYIFYRPISSLIWRGWKIYWWSWDLGLWYKNNETHMIHIHDEFKGYTACKIKGQPSCHSVHWQTSPRPAS